MSAFNINKILLGFLALLLISQGCNLPKQSSNTFSAEEILDRCIKAHGGEKSWKQFSANIEMKISRDKEADRLFTLVFQNEASDWSYTPMDKSYSLVQSKGVYSAVVNDSKLDTLKVFGAQGSQNRAQYMYEVYQYLFGVPFRLKQDKEQMSPTVQLGEFNNATVYKISFDYGEKRDKWTFFVNKETYRLAGYQFYHDDVVKDGEYIFTNDYSTINGLLQPREKKWHWNKDGAFFRTDSILSFH